MRKNTLAPGHFTGAVGEIDIPGNGEVGWWRQVEEWANGGNDKFGTCAETALANFHDLVTTLNGAAEVMTDGEVEYVYGQVTGFTPIDASTDKGTVLLAMLEYWWQNGWPGDPTMKPLGWTELRKDQIRDGVWSFGAVYAWVMLPVDDGDEPDFDDRGNEMTPEQGKHPHAVLAVGASDTTVTLVTWGRPVVVSRRWWDTYSQESFGVLHPAWKHPAGLEYTFS